MHGLANLNVDPGPKQALAEIPNFAGLCTLARERQSGPFVRISPSSSRGRPSLQILPFPLFFNSNTSRARKWAEPASVGLLAVMSVMECGYGAAAVSRTASLVCS